VHQDTAQLVDDSDPAKALFKTLRGQIPADAEEVLFQAAHLENRQLCTLGEPPAPILESYPAPCR